MALNHEVNGSPVEVKHISLSSNSVNYVVKDNKLVFADSGLSLSGPVNYTVVGTPTINDNVASGFATNASYLTLNNTISSWADSFEMQVKFTMPTTAQSGRAFIFANGAGQNGFLKANDNSVSFNFYDTDGNQWSGYSPVLAAGKTYVGKITYDSSTYTLTVTVKGDLVDSSSSHTFSYPLRDNATSTFQNIFIGGYGNTYFAAFNGSIDLNETYIKVNGNLWFYGKNYASANIAPVPSGYHFGDSQVGLTKVGIPTIVDGVASGFSSGNYLSIPALSYDNTTTPFNVNLRFSRGSGTTNSTAFCCRSVVSGTSYARLRFYMSSASKMTVTLRDFTEDTTDGTSVTTAFSTSLTEGVYYSANVNYDGVDTVTYTLYDNNGTELETLTKTMKTKISSGQNIRIGDYYSAAYWDGSVDLNQTYIKVNNEMWFNGAKSAAGVGYFDMRTQKFTGAPAGTTIGTGETPSADVNLIGLWHYDNNANNSAGTSLQLAWGGSPQYEMGKFNNATSNTGILWATATNTAGLITGDWTCDLWIKFGPSYGRFVVSNNGKFSVTNDTTNKVIVDVRGETGGDRTTTVSASNTEFHHIAFERYNGVLNIYVNGILKDTALSNVPTDPFTCGMDWASGYVVLDELRISNVARYGGQDFTPPTAPY